MSMLAEPRRKQKVINLRAKNNAWSNDSTKFGQRMLERMGWSSGKGLGAKENGIVEHVVARYKNDEKGLGFEDRSDQWTKHEDDFNSLLANLSNADNSTETLHSGISLEKKSKTSKARIHYHKFTRGKDLSRYSEKDLANIFGKKSFKEPKVEEVTKEDTIKSTEQVFTEKGNMDDYFKTKMAAFKSKSKFLNTDIESKDLVSDFAFKGISNYTEPENESKDLVSDFAFKGVSNYTEPENESKDLVSDFAFKGISNYTEPENESKDLVSDFAFKGFSNYTEPDNGGEQNGSGYHPFSFYRSQNKGESQVELCPHGETKNKKKKKSKQKEEPSEELVENNITECTKNVTQNVVPDEQAPEQIKAKKSKKKKHHKYIEDNIESVVEAGENLFACAQEAAEIVKADVEQKVKKSKKKKKGQECLHNIQVLEAKKNSSECSQEVSQGNESSKKSKKNRVQKLAAEKIQVCEMKQKKKNKNCVQDDIQKDVFMEDAVPKKKKKRKNHVI